MKTYPLVVLMIFGLFSCGNRHHIPSWKRSSDVFLATDGSCLHLVDEVKESFLIQNQDVPFRLFVVPEDSAIKMLVHDSVRCCLSSRPLSEYELQCVEEHQLQAMQTKVADDAMALLVSEWNADSLMNIDDLKKIVTGQITQWNQLCYSQKQGTLSLLFDASGSSSVRFMRQFIGKESVMKGNLYAQGSLSKVIESVASDSMVIGVVGWDEFQAWQSDSLLNSGQTGVRVMWVTRDSLAFPSAYQPAPSHIGYSRYPLSRSVYLITTDPRRESNTRLFYHYFKGNKGQKVVSDSTVMLPIGFVLPF